MEAFTIPGVVAAALLVSLVVGWALVRRWRPRRRRAEAVPVPAHWRPLLAERVPALRALDEQDWTGLLGLVRRFLQDKHFEGTGGLAVTEEMKLLIAAQACLLILNLHAGCYPGLRAVVVYPATFVPRSTEIDSLLHGGPVDTPEPLLGQHLRGVVLLSWDSVARSLVTGDGNVVFHEFAHELDREDGYVDGTPLLEAPSSTREWARVLQARFEELRRDASAGVTDLLSSYGATNRAEFFAVATETFFGRPEEMARRYPDLYGELRGFYRQDPAARLAVRA
jgi:Mlc titration factor MtfA (ptsG expression regulator)